MSWTDSCRSSLSFVAPRLSRLTLSFSATKAFTLLVPFQPVIVFVPSGFLFDLHAFFLHLCTWAGLVRGKPTYPQSLLRHVASYPLYSAVLCFVGIAASDLEKAPSPNRMVAVRDADP